MQRGPNAGRLVIPKNGNLAGQNLEPDGRQIHLIYSDYGGTTWNEIEVGDHRFKPAPIGGLGAGYQGDNIAMTSSGDTLWPAITGRSQVRILVGPLAFPDVHSRCIETEETR